MRSTDSSHFKVDTRNWPVVMLTTSGSPSDDQLRRHLKDIETQVLARQEPFVQVVDQSRAETLNATQRAIIAEHQESMDSRYAEYCLGEAYIADEKMKGVMVAVFWQAKPPYPYRFFSSKRQAKTWVESLLTPQS